MAPSLRETLARAAYSTLLRLVTPLYLARLWWRGRHEPAYRLAWRERLGGMDSASAARPARRCCARAMPRSGCPTTHPARCGASCVTTGPWPA